MRVACLWPLIAVASIGLALARTESVPVPDGQVAVEVTGKGPAVVFLHGAFLDQRTWDRQMPAFAKRFRVVRYDIRPFGRSSRVQKPYRTADDLLLVLNHLNIERAHVVGHSFGGIVALEFALLYPHRTASLVLAGVTPAGFAMPPEERKQSGAVFAAIPQGDDAIVAAWLALPLWAAARERPELMGEIGTMTRANLDVFRMAAPPFLQDTQPTVDRLDKVLAPTLIIVGKLDTPGVRQGATALAERIPNAVRVDIDGADHALPMGWHREFNAAVMAFLQDRRRLERR